MEPVPVVGWVFSPLDKQLALALGSLTPTQEEHLVRLATGMPFARAGQMLHALTGVQVSEAMVRRHTEQAGHASEAAQRMQSQGLEVEPPSSTAPALAQIVLSADGAFVPLIGGVWAEVRTVAIGEIKPHGEHTHTTNLSYFSRMTDATTFTELAEGEIQRRQVRAAEHVAAVMDGASWLQELVTLARPDAVRILDFPHAAQHLSALLETTHQAGVHLPVEARARCLHLLKHAGPRPVLRWLRSLMRGLLEMDKVREDVAYLHKREAFMQYPRYRAAGWPIGSGMVESANKLVMQARLKGAGMHWAACHVNPMLALRNAVCNDRWSEVWAQAASFSWKQRRHRRASHAQDRQHQATQRFLLAWMRFLLPPPDVQPPPPLPTSPPAPIAKGRPAATHPWRRPWVPRSSTDQFAKSDGHPVIPSALTQSNDGLGLIWPGTW